MARSTTKELTSGSPMKLILGFAVPLLFGMLFQQFYSLMDTIIVGRYHKSFTGESQSPLMRSLLSLRSAWFTPCPLYTPNW